MQPLAGSACVVWSLWLRRLDELAAGLRRNLLRGEVGRWLCLEIGGDLVLVDLLK